MSLLERKQNRGTDNLNTPEIALLPILEYLPNKIWECASGGGHLAELLRKYGKEVVEGYDFFVDNYQADVIVTNPPYSLKTKFLERAYSLNIPFAFLLPITALEGKDRQKLYRDSGLEIIFLPKRIDFTGKGAPWFATAWFTHGLNIGKELNFPKYYKQQKIYDQKRIKN